MTQPAGLDFTHDAARTSWVPSANAADADFPLQNLPFGRFRPSIANAESEWRIGVAIGEQVLDLRAALAWGGWSAQARSLLAPLAAGDLNAHMACPVAERVALRHALFNALAAPTGGAAPAPAPELAASLVPQSQAQMGLACRIGDYTDFFIGIHHATAMGKLFRPDNPLLPNYKWVPIGYHGRCSSIVVSGSPVRRPLGQRAPAEGHTQAQFGPSTRLDMELELGFLVAQGNALGQGIPIGQADEHLFGVCLFNDWSARDIQAWEYQPLGPFNAKNFASTLSPWVVTREALAPFRSPLMARAEGDPAPLPYLSDAANLAHGALDITVSVHLHSAAMQAAGHAPMLLSRSNAAQAAYWTPAQLIAHHTVGGCNLQPGDLLGSGTLSGAGAEQCGSLIEITQGGKKPLQLPGGEQRLFLQDGDTITFTGHCERAGARRIGFGACSGTIVAA